MSSHNATTDNSEDVPVIATTLSHINKIDEKSLDLQQTINNFSLFYGDIAEPPSVHEQKILSSYDLLVLDFGKVACKNLLIHRKQGKTLARVSLLTGGNGNGSAVAIDIAASGEVINVQEETQPTKNSLPSDSNISQDTPDPISSNSPTHTEDGSSSSTPVTEGETSSPTSTSNVTTESTSPVVATVTKPKNSAVAIMGGKRHKGGKKEFTSTDGLLRLVQSIKDRDGIDGIYITDVDKAVEQFGYGQIEFAVARIVDEANSANTPMIMLVDGGAFFVKCAWLPPLVHGVIVHNPTLEEYGDFKLLPRSDLTRVLESAKIQTQRRVDFITLAHESIGLDNIRSGMVRRFVKFCQEAKVVPNLCVDPTLTRAEMMHSTPSNPIGPMAVFGAPFFDDYFKAFRLHAGSDEKRKSDESWQKASIQEVVAFAKSVGYEVDPTDFQETFTILNEKHKHSAYIVWLGLLSHLFHLLSTKSAFYQDDHSQDIFEEASNIFRLMVEWEENRSSVEASMKSNSSMPVIAQTIEDDWGANLIEEDPAGAAGGEREFGAAFRPSEYRRVVDIQEKLRHKGLLKNLSKMITRETPEGKQQTYDLKFAEALDILDNIVSSPLKHAEVLSGFSKEQDVKTTEVLKQISELRNGLTQLSDNKEHNMIHVWECDPQALRFKSFSGEKRYFSVSNFDPISKVLHIYIGRHHPNISEALIYAFFSLKGFSHTCCVLLEVLCRRSAMPTSITSLSSTRWDKYTILSERMAWQLSQSSYKDLARYVMHTHKVLLQLKEANISSRQRYLAVKMAFQLKAAAKFLLLDDLQNREDIVRQNKAVLQYVIGNQDNILQNRLEAIVQEAAWRDEPNTVLKCVVSGITKGMPLLGTSNVGITKFTYDVLVGTGRAAAMEELEMQVRDANKFLLREPDLVTVYLEFNGLTEVDSQRLFGLSKFELGRVIYGRIREKMEYENPPVDSFEPEKGAYEPSAPELLSTKNFFLRWGDGLFFMLFMAINLAVVLPTGVGAYTSIHMTGTQTQIIAISMISAFITAGPINSAISRLGSLYLYQWSFSLAFTLISRFIACGLLFALSICAVVGIPLIVAHDAYNGAIFIMYFFLFVTTLLFMGALYNIHNGSIWLSVEGWCVITAQALEIAVVFAIFYGIPLGTIDGPLVHIIGLAVCALVLGISFFLLAHKHTMYIKHVKPTSEKDVMDWYQKVTGVESPPLATASDQAFADWYNKVCPNNQSQAVVVRWAKKMAAEIWHDARIAFASEIKRQSVLRAKTDVLIAERAKNYKHEELLMKWYILLSSKTRPEPFSKQWDIILAEAKDAYYVKTKTDSVLRGGLLWEAVAPYMMQGTFYYLLLFTDRIVQLLYTGSAKWFIPSTRYELTEGWALICLLLAIGSLEAIPIRISAFELARPLRLSSNTSDIQLIKAHNKFLMRSYWSDMARIFVVFVACAAVGLGMLIWYASEFTLVGSFTFNSELNLYCIFAFGYCGFVLGCYNALYISRQMAFVAKSLAASTVFGVVVGLILSEILKNSDASATGLVAGGWAYFGLTCWKVMSLGHYGRERRVEAKWGALQNNAMMTSGQKWIGTTWDENADASNPRVAHLLNHLFNTKNVVLTPNNDIGLEVANILRKSNEIWDSLPRDCLLKTAFPQAGSMFTTLLELWSKEKIILSVVEEGDLKVGEEEGFAAFSVALNVDKVAKENNKVKHRELSYDLRTSNGIPDDQIPTVLQIYVALNEFEPAQRIAEALVHEFAEQYLGMSHSRAVISELLVTPGDGTSVYVPTRIRRQIAAASRTKLLQLTDKTEDVVLDAVAEDVLLGQWEILSPAARTLVVAILEIPVYCSLAPYQTPAPAPDWICARAEISENMFNRGIADLQREGLWPIGDQREHLANVTLSAQLAIAVKKISVDTVSARMMAYAEHHVPIVSNVPRYSADVHSVSASEDLMMRLHEEGVVGNFTGIKPHIDAFLRLGFLAFTADATFAQEYAFSHSHTSSQGGLGLPARISSYLFVPVYNASRWLSMRFLWTVMLTRRKDFKLLNRQMNNGAYGTETYQFGKIIRVQHSNPSIPNRTGFVHHSDDTTATMNVYPQLVDTEPNEQRGRIATVVYSAQGRAERIVEYTGNGVKSITLYTYDDRRLPVKEIKYACTDPNAPQASVESIAQNTVLTEVTFDPKGRPSEATLFRDFNDARIPIKASYKYHADDIDSEPVEIVYSHVPEETQEGEMREVCITVRYYTFTQRIQYVDWQLQGGVGCLLRTYFNYRNLNHVKQVTFKQSADGQFKQRFLTPSVIQSDPLKLLKHQFVSVRQAVLAPYLTKRHFFWSNCFAGKKPWSRELCHNTKYPTLKARVLLWKSWQKGKLEGVFVQMWDEAILREERSLWKYWFLRDWGKGVKAQVYLKEKQHLVTPRIQPEASHPDLRTHTMTKISDLLGLVPGGFVHDMVELESNHQDNKLVGSLEDEPALDVVGIDSGTWPADGGGVAACRRDVVDRLSSISWTQMAEIGNPMKLTQYQIERNVRSLTLIPLWGDIVNDPCALLLTDIPYGLLAARRWRTTPKAIEKYFIPILEKLVESCSMILDPTDQLVQEQTSMIVNMYTYFQEFDWLATWSDPLVNATWRSGWCNAYGPEVRQEFIDGKLIDAELPTMQDLDVLLSLFGHFLFPITVKLPDYSVYHASHHGIQSILGVVARHLYGSQFIIWDHGMLWREKVKALAELSQFSLFIRNGLLGLSRLAMRVNYENADTITSCCTKGNPDWELWLGGRNQGVHSKPRCEMQWRMSPVLNGMETDKFHPRPNLESHIPTVVQLSHVYDLKDIKTAIRSAAVIVNQFKITNFNLAVYGSTTKDLDYAAECRDLISDEGLSSNVFLMGLADAAKVLGSGWVFFNSSQSEGLPLALGEAGLCAVPVVCTDVGGSREVVTGETVFGRVVPPRNPYAAARGILEVLAMVDSNELDELLKDPKALAARIEATETTRHRRELGTRFRAFVIENFSMERYLREHEQQLWLGAYRCMERRVEAATIRGNVCVRQSNPYLTLHMREAVIPRLPSADSLGKAQDLPLYDLYADAPYRMIETAMEKNKLNFLKDLAARNHAPISSVKTIAPFNPPGNKTPRERRNSYMIKYYMSPAVFLPKVLGSSSPNFRRKQSLSASGAARDTPRYEPAYTYDAQGNRSPAIRSPNYEHGSTPHFPNSPGVRRTKHDGGGASFLLTTHLMEMFEKDPDRKAKVQELVNALVGRLGRVALTGIEDLIRNMDAWIDSSMTSMSAEEIKKQLEELQIIICDDSKTYSEQEKDAANIQYERVFKVLTQTAEYQAEIARIAEEKRRINEPLNRAAWESMIRVYSREHIKNDPAIRDKLKQNPELGLICMDPRAIGAKHQGDFQMYTLNNLSMDEMRAIRAILPRWRSDQRRQQDWQDVLENKIDQMAKNPPKDKNPPAAPKPPAMAPAGKPPTAPKKKPTAPPSGDVFAELLAKRKRVN